MSKIVAKRSNTNVSVEVEQVIKKITNAWNKAAEYIIEVSMMLNDLQNGDKKTWSQVRDTLIERKIMSRTTISNLISVGKNKLLTSNVEKLPPAYNTLWVLSTLEDQELKSKLKEGLITPELRLEDVRKWKKSVDDDDFDVVEIVEEKSDKKKCIVISISDDYVNHHYEDIDDDMIKIRMIVKKYGRVESVGTLKKKLAGD